MGHLLEVKNLKTQFNMEDGKVKAVDGVSYYVDEGEIIAFVGESGSGKSVTQYSGLQLIPIPPGRIVGGEVVYEGKNILEYTNRSKGLRDIRGGEIGVIFQEPMTSLNPVYTIGRQIQESVILHLKMTSKQARARAIELLKMVGIPDAEQRIDDYPHQFSGGMRQRVMIAIAMSCNPKILIADEATTALDVTTQAQILELLRNIVRETNTSMVMVTHNLSVVARYADRIYVMYAGGIIEYGTAKQIFANPRHPYTIGLLNAVPGINDPKDRKLIPIDGIMPSLIDKPDMCSFLDRCKYCTKVCANSPAPVLEPVTGDDGHYSACYNIEKIDLEKEKASKISLKERKQKNLDEKSDIVLSVESLKLHFPVTKGLFNRKIGEVKAVDGVSFHIRRGETLGLVGESGCGKTTVARSVLRLYEPTDGTIVFEGNDITKLSQKQLRPIRRDMSLIFQDPYSSLDPRMRAEDIIGEPIKNYKLAESRESYRETLKRLFDLVGLDFDFRDRVPHEFSGGQRQRIGIARALASNPSFIVCDEAISALDVSIQAQIINLLEELQEKLGLTYLFIAHDLSVVRHISDRVVVMYLGKVVETTDWESLYSDPLHPYTQALLNAVPVPDPFEEEKRVRNVIKGEVPSLMNRPKGCVFSNRCPLATKECGEGDPPLEEKKRGHFAACIKV